MVKFSHIWIETAEGRFLDCKSLEGFDQFRCANWEDRTIEERLRINNTFIKYYHYERSWETQYNLPPGSLSGYILILGTIREAKLRIRSQLVRDVFTNPETRVEIEFTNSGLAYAVIKTPEVEHFSRYSFEPTLIGL